MKRLVEVIRRIAERVKRREREAGVRELRETFSDWLLLRMWLACAVENWSFSILYAKLPSDGGWIREKWQLPNRLPSRSQAYERLRREGFERRRRMFFEECARESIRLSTEEETQVAAIDLTALDASYHDSGAGGGHSSEKWTFWGYKLGLVVIRSGAPIAFRLMKARWTEGTYSRPMIREGKQRLARAGRLKGLKYVTADKGFDAEKNFREVARGCGARMVCPGKKRRFKRRVKNPEVRRRALKLHPYRTRALNFYRTPTGKRIYRARTVVEQINSQLKGSIFGIGHFPPHVRGLRRVGAWCLGKLTYFNLAFCAKRLQGRSDRSLREFAA